MGKSIHLYFTNSLALSISFFTAYLKDRQCPWDCTHIQNKLWYQKVRHQAYALGRKRESKLEAIASPFYIYSPDTGRRASQRERKDIACESSDYSLQRRLKGNRAIKIFSLLSHICLGYRQSRAHDPISFVCWYTLRRCLKTNMISARSLNTLDHRKEATRDSCRKSNYPSGSTWLSTQLGGLPAENTGQGEILSRAVAAAALGYFYPFLNFTASSEQFINWQWAGSRQQKCTYDNLMTDYSQPS